MDGQISKKARKSKGKAHLPSARSFSQNPLTDTYSTGNGVVTRDFLSSFGETSGQHDDQARYNWEENNAHTTTGDVWPATFERGVEYQHGNEQHDMYHQPVAMHHSEAFNNDAMQALTLASIGGTHGPTQPLPLQRHDACFDFVIYAKPNFFFATENDAVYMNLDADQKLVIVELIHQIRPVKYAIIRRQLRTNLQPLVALDLLSNNINRIEAAVEHLYPDKVTSRQGYVRYWMSGLHNKDRVLIMNKLAEATLQSAETLRDYFIQEEVSPSIGDMILHANTPEQVLSIARDKNLILPEKKTIRPWQRGADQLQKRAVIQRMMASPLIGSRDPYDLLKKKKVTPGYGLKMIKASNLQFDEIMMSLLSNWNDDLPVL
ncbi:hypothetical protein CBS101457_000161 [Exobasidium rhododendri]|nr:hypothetical protein CBS101457_000161 [Exobasidium rhododendri]